PRGTIHIYRSKFLSEGVCYEQLRLNNHGLSPVPLSLLFEFDADFADIFEVRGTHRAKRGQRQPDRVQSGVATLSYLGLDNVLRSTDLQFSPAPTTLTAQSAEYQIQLSPREESTIFLTVACRRDSASPSTKSFSIAFDDLDRREKQKPFEGCRITTSN